MLKKFFSRALGTEEDQSDLEEGPAALDDKHSWIRNLVELFPIGKKQRYYPEYKTDIVLDTVIIAYCVNGYFLYSSSAIEMDGEGNPVSFRIGQDGERLPVAHVHSFQMVVPDTSELEKKLDYERRAVLGRVRQFARGNSITMISTVPGRGVATVDTEIVKLVAQKDGPYAPATLVLLSPDLDTLVLTDQRAKARAKISVPLVLTTEDGPLSGLCKIVDISDDAIRMHISNDDARVPAMEIGDEVVMTINMLKAEQQFHIKGTVIRSYPGVRVIRLDALLKDRKFVRFSPLDHLELKAGLINY